MLRPAPGCSALFIGSCRQNEAKSFCWQKGKVWRWTRGQAGSRAGEGPMIFAFSLDTQSKLCSSRQQTLRPVFSSCWLWNQLWLMDYEISLVDHNQHFFFIGWIAQEADMIEMVWRTEHLLRGGGTLRTNTCGKIKRLGWWRCWLWCMAWWPLWRCDSFLDFVQVEAERARTLSSGLD